ncbi:MAG: phage major capsid protein, partial [Alphaproteobacteria bacterium]|nr:phage major capsid protein [Alphaproteobacteria bacterium]
MAGNVNFDNLLTTTLESRTGKLADNVTNNNAILKRLKERGNIRPISGGSKIVEEIEFNEGDSYWYTGFDT